MIVIVASITAGVGAVAALIGAQARWDRREGRGQSPLYQPFAELPGGSYTVGRLGSDWFTATAYREAFDQEFPAPPVYRYGAAAVSEICDYAPGKVCVEIAPGDEVVAEFARDPDHGERLTVQEVVRVTRERYAAKYGPDFSTPRMREPAVKLRDQMFPPGAQHYWVPNGEHPGQDGKWWVFLGATRTPWGYWDRDEAVTTAELQNRTEKRGKYAPPRR